MPPSPLKSDAGIFFCNKIPFVIWRFQKGRRTGNLITMAAVLMVAEARAVPRARLARVEACCAIRTADIQFSPAAILQLNY